MIRKEVLYGCFAVLCLPLGLKNASLSCSKARVLQVGGLDLDMS